MHYAIKSKYPIETKEQLAKAASYFEKYLSRLEPVDRAIAAHNLEKRAEELGVYLDNTWIDNYSNMFKTASLSPSFNQSIEIRKNNCAGVMIKVSGDREVKASDFIDTIIEKNAHEPIELMKSIEMFDKLSGLSAGWDTSIPDPVASVFGRIDGGRFDCVKVAGISLRDLKKTVVDSEKMTKLAAAFGEDFCSSFKADPVSAVEKLNPLELKLVGDIAA